MEVLWARLSPLSWQIPQGYPGQGHGVTPYN